MKIIKIPTYNPYGDTYEGRYKHVCKLLMQKNDPPSDRPGSLDCGKREVFVSSLNRARGSIDKVTVTQVTVCVELREVPFDLSKYCTEDEFIKFGSTAVRKAFMKAFIEDGLEIKREELRSEIERLFDLKNIKPDAICITHTFRMKLIEIYKAVGGDLFAYPDLLSEHMRVDIHLYKFEDSFEI